MTAIAARVLRYSIYPVVFGGAVVALIAGATHGIPYARFGPIVLLASAMVVIALERWWPHARAWQGDQGDAATDVLHLVGNVVVSQVSVAGFVALRSFRGEKLILWPSHTSMALQIVLATLLVDLGLYAVHRASHGIGFLWKLHAIHHSPRRVYWVNGQRRHLVHELMEGTPALIVLLSLGAPPSAYACAIAIVTVHLMLQHGNVDYRVGPLRHVFAVAELHRWHHQRLWRDVQGNYGAILSIWDRAFGTALLKQGDAPLDVGMDDEPDLPTDWAGQQMWPFRRRRAREVGSQEA